MAYTTLGPFSNGSASPPINAGFLNGLETWIAAADPKVTGGWQKTDRNFVTPWDYGAVSGTGDNTAAVQAAVDSGYPVLIAGTFYTTDIVNTKGNPLFGWGTSPSRLIALPGTGTLYSMRQATNTFIANVWLNGNNNAATVLDTSYDKGTGAAPSVNNVYTNIRISKYTTLGWNAAWNNDCEFASIDIEASGTAPGLSVLAAGGGIGFHDCRNYGLTKIACQNATFTNCVLKGVEVNGGDTNALMFNGGYYYSNAVNKSVVYIADNSNITAAPYFAGCNLVIETDGGNVIGTSSGAPGTLFLGATMMGGILISAGTTTVTKSLTRSTLVVPSGSAAKFTLIQAYVNGVSISANLPANLTVKTSNSYVNGAASNTGL